MWCQLWHLPYEGRDVYYAYTKRRDATKKKQWPENFNDKSFSTSTTHTSFQIIIMSWSLGFLQSSKVKAQEQDGHGTKHISWGGSYLEFLSSAHAQTFEAAI